MHIEMIDLLRCVNAHEDGWLVASFRDVTNRMVMEATLGCPICSAEYQIKNGVADFTGGERIPAGEEDRSSATHRREELATRAGAYLDASQPGTTIVLGGLWAHAAQELSEMAEVRVIGMNAPADVKESERVGLIRIARAIPLAANSAHGIALDGSFEGATIGDAMRITKPVGRLVGPASLAPPAGSAVLAHDEQYWVAEKTPEMIPLKRSST